MSCNIEIRLENYVLHTQCEFGVIRKAASERGLRRLAFLRPGYLKVFCRFYDV
jgi:hypothetical protein